MSERERAPHLSCQCDFVCHCVISVCYTESMHIINLFTLIILFPYNLELEHISSSEQNEKLRKRRHRSIRSREATYLASETAIQRKARLAERPQFLPTLSQHIGHCLTEASKTTTLADEEYSLTLTTQFPAFYA